MYWVRLERFHFRLGVLPRTNLETLPLYYADLALTRDGSRLAATMESKNSHFILVYDIARRKLIDKIGGANGFKDGSFEETLFDYCMGVDFSVDGKSLYIAECVKTRVKILFLAFSH